jgi:hypothetical protein
MPRGLGTSRGAAAQAARHRVATPPSHLPVLRRAPPRRPNPHIALRTAIDGDHGATHRGLPSRPAPSGGATLGCAAVRRRGWERVRAADAKHTDGPKAPLGARWLAARTARERDGANIGPNVLAAAKARSTDPCAASRSAPTCAAAIRSILSFQIRSRVRHARPNRRLTVPRSTPPVNGYPARCRSIATAAFASLLPSTSLVYASLRRFHTPIPHESSPNKGGRFPDGSARELRSSTRRVAQLAHTSCAKRPSDLHNSGEIAPFSPQALELSAKCRPHRNRRKFDTAQSGVGFR